MNPPQMEDIFQQYESQYVTDLDGRLIRIEAATRDDMTKLMTLKIDGEEVKAVPKAVPATDDQGNIKRDEEGHIIPRLTTVYDAITWRYQNTDKEFPGPDPKNPVPVLCHQNHLRPIGVCRVCSCLTVKGGSVGEKLIPSCQHPLVEGMEVHTVASEVAVKAPGQREPVAAGQYLQKSVKVLLELLAANSLHEIQPENDRHYQNELLDLCNRFGVGVRRTGDRKVEIATAFKVRDYDEKKTDDTSPVISVDHNNCILCDRCVRGCSEVKPFKIIGHNGFGHKATIAFDLNEEMGKSGCVSCGECTVSCPTGALTFKGSIYQNRDPWEDESLKPKTVKAEILEKDPLFAGVPYSFLKWNEGAVGEVALSQGDKLCQQGEYGSTAFLIKEGAIDVVINKEGQEIKVATMASKNVIVGEAAVMAHQPRGATLRTAPTGAKVWVVKRNMLHMLQRNRQARTILFPIYRERALDNYLRRGNLFKDLNPEQNAFCKEYLAGCEDVELIQVDPGQSVFLQGNEADSFYVIARGHVTVQETRANGHTLTLNYLGRGQSFGEIGLLTQLSEQVAAEVPPEMRGRRTFTCAALDHVDLISIPGKAFKGLMDASELLVKHARAIADVASQADLSQAAKAAQTIDPATAGAAWRTAKSVKPEVFRQLLSGESIKARLIGKAIETVRAGKQRKGDVSLHQMGEFTRTGLYQGQSLLVLDLNRCTRCQECVKACSDSHQDMTRLVLEGNRFDKYLVPSACRSCHDPACLVGCPVDAIHRRPAAGSKSGTSLAIFIEDHCIGCSLCAHNCPFGSIHMLEKKDAPGKIAGHISGRRAATNCDLCESVDGNPRCVKHCPHEAAMRMPGIELARLIGLHPAGPATSPTAKK